MLKGTTNCLVETSRSSHVWGSYDVSNFILYLSNWYDLDLSDPITKLVWSRYIKSRSYIPYSLSYLDQDVLDLT